MTAKTNNIFLILLLSQIFLLQACSNSFETQEAQLKSGTESTNSTLSTCSLGQTQACQVLHGSGIQHCSSEGSFTSCQTLSCDSGFNLTNGQCSAQLCQPQSVIACAGLNGEGIKSCLPDGLGYEECELRNCRAGFNLQNGVCISNPPASSPPPNSALKIVNMGTLASKNSSTGPVIDYYWRRTDYRPQSNEIRVWSFTSESLSQLQAQGTLSSSGTYILGHTTSVAILGTTPTGINPAMYISESSGNLNELQNGAIVPGCGRVGAETVRVTIIVSTNPAQTKLDFKTSGVNENAYCILKANTKYYVNTFSIESQAGKGLVPATNCSSPHCGYSFLAN